MWYKEDYSKLYANFLYGQEELHPGKNAHQEEIRELLQLANIGNMNDIQNLFKESMPSSWRTTWGRRRTELPKILLQE